MSAGAGGSRRATAGGGDAGVFRRLGGVRPSQLMWAYGVGAMVDLPNMSVMVAGLDDWEADHQGVLSEDRLLGEVRRTLGDQVAQLRTPPWMQESRSGLDEWARVGVPVVPFPRWLRCTAGNCNYLGPIDSGMFELETRASRPDRARYVHRCTTKGRRPSAVPARFVVACPKGHLDEFPWMELAHKNAPCAGAPILELKDTTSGTRSTDMTVRCRTCGQYQSLSQAFGDRAGGVLPGCRGREPHLRRFSASGCSEQAKALLLGASNAWFPLTATVVSIPSARGDIDQMVADLWADLAPVPNRAALEYATGAVGTLAPLRGYDLDRVWEAAEARRAAGAPAVAATADLYGPEWEVFTDPDALGGSVDFKIRPARAPHGYAGRLGPTVLVERLRAVVAMVGFTRIDGPEAGVPSDEQSVTRAPLARAQPTWVPATQTRGEGLLVRMDEAAVQEWEVGVAETDQLGGLEEAYRRWRQRRRLGPGPPWPGPRYLLVHSLSHALLNELSLECGYAAASIRERIYAREPGPGRVPMAGVLLYTAAPDSEGTLGGLVSLGEPTKLGEIVGRALQRMALCSSDPMCAAHLPDEGEDSLHAAACHACLFVPETSCEQANRYLDRTVLTATLAGAGIGYFQS